MLKTFATVVVTAILVSAFWVFYNGITGDAGRSDGRVEASGDKTLVDPRRASSVVVAESVTVGPAGLAIPVAGIKSADLIDTFTQARAGGARVHDAIDIMAPTGRPVIAAGPGTVEKLFYSKGGGGLSAYVRSNDQRWNYYYAHLDAYAPGLREGQRLARGEHVGFVGYSGNANPAGPHLHFAVNRMSPGDKWYGGSPVNPYPLLAGKAVAR